jgi:hypothetical protein
MDIFCAILPVLGFLFRMYMNAKGITPLKFNAPKQTTEDVFNQYFIIITYCG